MKLRIALNGALAFGVVVLPYIASAQTLMNTLGLVSAFLNALIGLFITIAIIVFFWGLIKYLMNLSDENERKAGLLIMTYGIIALFVMVSIWGILGLLRNTFKVQANSPIVPQGIQLTNTSGY